MIKAILKIRRTIFVLSLASILLMPASAYAATSEADCNPSDTPSSFLGIPHWYQFMTHGKKVPVTGSQDYAYVKDLTGHGTGTYKCIPEFGGDGNSVALTDIWLIALAIISILLRIGGFAAFAMIIFSGFKYITSQGNADATKAARQTIINAFIGMVITIIAAVSVSFGVRLLQK